MPWPKGVPRGPEHMRKMREAQNGPYPASPELREKRRIAATGVRFSPERRAAISAAKRGKTLSPEHRAWLRAWMMGNRRVIEAPVKGECVYCFGPAQAYDHVIPRGREGWDAPENVVLACYFCNASKKDRTPEEWWAYLTGE